MGRGIPPCPPLKKGGFWFLLIRQEPKAGKRDGGIVGLDEEKMEAVAGLALLFIMGGSLGHIAIGKGKKDKAIAQSCF